MIRRPQSYRAWAIKGRFEGGREFLYYGTSPTRIQAIAEHTTMKGLTWAQCRKHGDRCVKVELREL